MLDAQKVYDAITMLGLLSNEPEVKVEVLVLLTRINKGEFDA